MRGSNWPAMKRERETPKRFELLPAALVSGAVGLAVVLVVAAAVVYLESPLRRAQDDSCRRVFCSFGAQCVHDQLTRQAFCRCPDRCSPDILAPVCGTDGISYASACQLKIRACGEQRRIVVRHSGACDAKDPCLAKECRFGAHCRPSPDARNADCVCPTTCATYGDARGSRPVCGSDGRDYANVCELRRHACRQMRDVHVRFGGACDPCDGVECPAAQVCQLDGQRNPICRCNAICEDDLKPVCGSDGKTYTNDCSLRVEACKARRSLRIVHSGQCGESNPCASLQCARFQECEIDRYGIATCQCPPPCAAILRPVCASDARTYDSECEMRRQACLLHRDLHKKHSGACGEEGACTSGHACRWGATCVVRPSGEAECQCASCSEELEPVCASDVSFANECKMRREFCLQKRPPPLVFTPGLCSGCENKNCRFYANCESDGRCVCPASCGHVEAPICGSDGRTYVSECEMRVQACNHSQMVTVVSRGPCDLCLDVHCKFGARCESGRCVCPTECPEVAEPVCASDGVTYPSECHLKSAACRQSADIGVRFFGECDQVSSGYTKVCDLNTCRFGGVCDYDPDGVPRCTCTYQCPPSGADSEPVCGSDGRLYDNECKLQEEACARQQPIPTRACHELQILPCDGEPPLVDPLTRKHYFCGDGPHARTCPPNSFCQKGSAFAKCCREVASVRSCAETTFGCCPDGKTAAQGSRDGGCPSTCNCNRLGSYSTTCDPTTLQCHCKPGVGGVRCDRCEAGFWGLHKISEGNSGCIPCACNALGSVRDDCEQMSGRCVCKAGVQGMKCDVCPDATVLTPDGCTDVALTRTLVGSCADLKCHFGATCRARGPHVQCACEFKCADLKASPVCASDANTYASECQMRLLGCRYQKKVSVRHSGQCAAAESVTVGPAKRSTVFKTTPEKWTREVSETQSGATTPTHATDLKVERPAFDGHALLELARLEAYTRLTLEVEFTSFRGDAILLYNGQTPSGEGDFAALTLRQWRVEFRYNLGSGTVVLASQEPVAAGRPVRVVAKRYLWDGMLSVDGQEDVSGRSHGDLKSLDLSDNLFVGGVASEQNKVFENIGVKDGLVGCLLRLRIGRRLVDLAKDVIRASNVRACEHLDACVGAPCANQATCVPQPQPEAFRCVCGARFTGRQCETAVDACASSPCTSGSTCVAADESSFVCQCPPGRTGKVCDDYQREMAAVRVPDFWGASFLQLPTLEGVGVAFTIEVWFLTRALHGLLLYNGQHASRGDFVALNLEDGRLHFRYDLGAGQANDSGLVAIASAERVSLGEWHSARITRRRKVGTLQLDDGPVVEAEAKGALSELNLQQPLFVGGVDDEHTVNRDSGVTAGLNGAIQRLVVNGEVWDNLVQRALRHRNVPEYRGPPCGSEWPCQNGGVCTPQLNDYTCKCRVGFSGKKCDKAADAQDEARPVAFGGSTFLMFAHKAVAAENRLHVVFSSVRADGLLLWTNKGATAHGDYLCLALADGFLELSFNLGKQRHLLVMRSLEPLNDGLWHSAVVLRNQRAATLTVDDQLAVSGESEPGATDLNTDGVLWIGGAPGLPTGLPPQYYRGFEGCVESVRVDGESLALTTHAAAKELQRCDNKPPLIY